MVDFLTRLGRLSVDEGRSWDESVAEWITTAVRQGCLGMVSLNQVKKGIVMILYYRYLSICFTLSSLILCKMEARTYALFIIDKGSLMCNKDVQRHMQVQIHTSTTLFQPYFCTFTAPPQRVKIRSWVMYALADLNQD